MKQLFFSKIALILLSTITFVSTSVQAADVEEVSYDDLLNQLNRKKSFYSESSSGGFDDVMIHAGFGLTSSVTNVNINGEDSYRHQNGFQLALGINLFSPEWAAEGVIRNFGQSSSGTETRSLRETDLRFMYVTKTNATTGIRAGMGLGTRYFKLTDEIYNVYISETTPSAQLFGGVDAYLSKRMSLGFELAGRYALVSRTVDKSAMDLTVHLDTYF